MSMFQCVPNFSTCSQSIIIEIKKAIECYADVRDFSFDIDHNRSVITFIGTGEEVKNAVFAAAKIAIKKIDLTTQDKLEELYQRWKELLPKAEIFPISATEKFNLDPLFGRILALLPESPPWYDKDIFTDRNLRFFASEIIREKILLNYSKEIPYCTEVVIESFKENNDIWNIEAIIYVTRDSQKGIIIGKGGAALKKVGTEARKDMEAFFEKRVFLQIFVKVNPDWREDKRRLKQFGYIQD